MIHDLRYALRSIWRGKLFALVALAAFSFGIGATATVFSVIDAVLLRPAAFPKPNSVVTVEVADKKDGWGHVSPAAFDAIRSRTDLFSEVAGSRIAIFTVTHIPVPDQVFGSSVSAVLFNILGAHPWKGRLLQPADDRLGAPPVVLLSYKGWGQLFAGDLNIVGKVAIVDGNVCTIVGVMPSDFVMPGPGGAGDVWVPLQFSPAELSSSDSRSVD